MMVMLVLYRGQDSHVCILQIYTGHYKTQQSVEWSTLTKAWKVCINSIYFNFARQVTNCIHLHYYNYFSSGAAIVLLTCV